MTVSVATDANRLQRGPIASSPYQPGSIQGPSAARAPSTSTRTTMRPVFSETYFTTCTSWLYDSRRLTGPAARLKWPYCSGALKLEVDVDVEAMVAYVCILLLQLALLVSTDLTVLKVGRKRRDEEIAGIVGSRRVLRKNNERASIHRVFVPSSQNIGWRNQSGEARGTGRRDRMRMSQSIA